VRGTTGYARLRSVIQREVVPRGLPAKAVQDWCDGGRIVDGMRLKPDHFDGEYAPGEYKISRLLKLALIKDEHPVINVTVSSESVGDHGSHSHAVTADVPAIANPHAPLAVGDRVLIVWLDNEREPVVVDRFENT
jgi:hypothetical protein